MRCIFIADQRRESYASTLQSPPERGGVKLAVAKKKRAVHNLIFFLFPEKTLALSGLCTGLPGPQNKGDFGTQRICRNARARL